MRCRVQERNRRGWEKTKREKGQERVSEQDRESRLNERVVGVRARMCEMDQRTGRGVRSVVTYSGERERREWREKRGTEEEERERAKECETEEDRRMKYIPAPQAKITCAADWTPIE